MAEEPVLRQSSMNKRADQISSKLYNQTEKLQQIASAYRTTTKDGTKKKGPAGGYDATPIPKAQPGYTIKITFNRADNLPFADFLAFSSDPYIIATLKVNLTKRHKQDPDLVLRTPTIHRTTNPVWNTEWIIANIPASGFYLKCKLYDEDPADRDDRLGNAHVYVSDITETWQGFQEQKYSVKKRAGSKRAYTFRGCAALLSRRIKFGGDLIVSVENLGRTNDQNGGRAYTIGPLPWSRHYSPLIGMITGTKSAQTGKDGKPGTQRYNFQAIQMQFRGPVPEQLYHRYVEFKPFVAGMFNSHSIRGRILNRALHNQHYRIYNYDRTTSYGVYQHPCHEMTKRFLDFVHYDQGGRIFTYVLTLDGQWRFTETGNEFGIDMLSKHSMHSDVSIYIAFSGEFFIRRLKNPHKLRKNSDIATDLLPPSQNHEAEDEKAEPRDPSRGLSKSSQNSPGIGNDDEIKDEESHKKGRRRGFFGRRTSHDNRSSLDVSQKSHSRNGSAEELPSLDPEHYELIIDNDSGTYRPNAHLLPVLKHYMAQNLVGLRVVTLDCQADEQKMKELKDEQRERKKHSGQRITYMQNSSFSSISSISSSDISDMQARAEDRDPDAERTSKYRRSFNKLRGSHNGGSGTDTSEQGQQHEGEKSNGFLSETYAIRNYVKHQRNPSASQVQNEQRSRLPRTESDSNENTTVPSSQGSGEKTAKETPSASLRPTSKASRSYVISHPDTKMQDTTDEMPTALDRYTPAQVKAPTYQGNHKPSHGHEINTHLRDRDEQQQNQDSNHMGLSALEPSHRERKGSSNAGTDSFTTAHQSAWGSAKPSREQLGQMSSMDGLAQG